jgi:hypothetical protein
MGPGCRRANSGQTKVDELHRRRRGRRQHHVAGLQVEGDVAGHVHGFKRRQGAAAIEARLQAHAPHQLEHEKPGAVADAAEVVHGEDRWMRQPHQQPRLALKALHLHRCR